MVRNILIPTILVIFSILGLACEQQGARTELDIAAPVTVQTVDLKSIEEFVTTTGTVEATQTFDLKTEAQGLYHLMTNPRTKMPFAKSNEVKKDEVIVTLESREYEISVNIESKKLGLDLAQRELEMQQSLFEKGGVTQRDLTTAQQSLINAKLSYDNGLIQLAKLKVVSPFDGIITDITYYTPGIKISSGSAIATVKNYTHLTMDVNFPAKQLGSIRENQQARITNVNVLNKTFNGKVSQVSPALDPTTRAFKATVLIDNPVLILKPGMFVKVEVVVDKRENTVVIPKDVIIARRQNKMVYIVDRGVAVERQITTGLENPTEIEVTEGLAANDRLVIKGFETLRNRARVKVTQ